MTCKPTTTRDPPDTRFRRMEGVEEAQIAPSPGSMNMNTNEFEIGNIIRGSFAIFLRNMLIMDTFNILGWSTKEKFHRTLFAFVKANVTMDHSTATTRSFASSTHCGFQREMMVDDIYCEVQKRYKLMSNQLTTVRGIRTVAARMPFADHC